MSTRTHRPVVAITARRVYDQKTDPPLTGVRCSYLKAILSAGAIPLIIPVITDLEAVDRLLLVADGLLLPGGEDVDPKEYGEAAHPNLGGVDRERDLIELHAARWFLKEKLPILGICRGIQVLNVACGGNLFQDLDSQRTGHPPHGRSGWDELSHGIAITPQSKLASIMEVLSLRINSLHHQAVRELGSGLVTSGVSEDGVIEAIEHLTHPFCIGVQCHPEMLWDAVSPEWSKLFSAFVDACRNALKLR